MFAGFRGLKVFAVGAVFVMLAQSSSAENKCKTGVQECTDHGYDPYANKTVDNTGADTASGTCRQIGFNQKTCEIERNLAWGYTAMAAICGTVCAVGTAVPIGKVLEPVCIFGSLAMGLSEIIFTQVVSQNAESYANSASKDILNKYSLNIATYGNTLFYGLLAASRLGACLPTSLHNAARTQKGACISTGINAAFAASKWINRHQIVKSSAENLTNLGDLWKTDKTIAGTTSGAQTGFSNSGGGSSPPPVADTRSASTEVAVKDPGVDTARIGESYAMADSAKLFGNPTPQDFNKAVDALKNLGISPDGLMNALESGGVGGAVGAALGSVPNGDAIAAELKDIEKRMSNELNTPQLAFEKSAGGGGSGGGKKDGGMDLSSLFGARGPAGDGAGGVKGIQFGGFNNDIWHAGTTLSIFEIVSRKTQTVSSRVER